MSILKIGICDDNPYDCERIVKEIEFFAMDNIVDFKLYLYSGAIDAMREDKLNCLDLLFLDIDMGEMNGIELKNYLLMTKVDVSIVFITNHDQYMLEAFGKNVWGYVTKDNVSHIKKYLTILLNNNRTDNIVTLSGAMIRKDSIIYIKTEDGYSYINTSDREYTSSLYINNIIKKINYHLLVRTHRSFVVNMSYIREVSSNSVTLIDGSVIPVSRKYKKHFRNIYLEYLRKS